MTGPTAFRIPYGRQSIDSGDVEAVLSVLRSDWLTQGPAVPRFEAEFARACDAPHSVAVSSATAGLHLGCLALDVGVDDRVWTSPVSFVASANAALYCGAKVDFVDIDPESLNIDVNALERKLRTARVEGRLPKVVIPVHFGGQSPDIRRIKELAGEYGFKILEDASHAVGAEYAGRKVGSCAYSDLCVFSFHPVKIVTTAEGGLVTTRDPELHLRLVRLRTHGITRDPDQMTDKDPAPWVYEQIELGYNYRLTDLQAALGSSQLRRLAAFVDRRNALAERYANRLAGLPVSWPSVASGRRSSYHLFVVRLQLDRIGKTQRACFEGMKARGIDVNLHYIPIYLQPYYRKLGFEPGLCPEAETYYRQAMTLPLYPGMTDTDQDRVVDALREVILER